MSKKRRYYRTAALLGPHEQHVAVHPHAKGARVTLRAIRIPWKIVTPVLGLIALVLWVILGDAWYLKWEDLTVAGLSYVDLEEPIKMSADILGYHRFHLKPEEAEQRLEAMMPYFSEVEVSCGPFLPSCEIKVKERSPILTWLDGSSVYWIDGTGVAFPALGDRPDLPTMRGSLPRAGSAYTITEVLRGVAALAEIGIPVDELECARERGLVWTNPDGCRVAFGAGSNMAERWQTYQFMVAHFAETGAAVRQMDVRFRDGITYALERSW